MVGTPHCQCADRRQWCPHVPRHLFCLDDGSPEAHGCALVAHRLASGLGARLTLVGASAESRAQARDGRDPAPLRVSADDRVLAVAVPWSGDGARLLRLARALPFPLLAVSAAGARRVRRSVPASQRVVLHVAAPGEDAAARVAAGAAVAMENWQAVLAPGEFAGGPVGVGSRVELIVMATTTLERRGMRRALEHSTAPLLVVPAHAARAWPELPHHALAPLVTLA